VASTSRVVETEETLLEEAAVLVDREVEAVINEGNKSWWGTRNELQLTLYNI
jgi:hypothetical protein